MRNKIIGLVVLMLVFVTLIFPVHGLTPIEKTQANENNSSTERDTFYQKSLPIIFYRILNKDWDYWSNAPHVYSLPEGNVGIGIDTPSEKLDVVGTVKMTGFKMLTGANDGYILTCNSSGMGTWQSPTSGIGGSGTANYITKFTAATTLGNAGIYETSAGDIGIGTTSPSCKLEVNGDVNVNGGISFETKTGYVSVSAAAFRPRTDGYLYTNGGMSLHPDNSASTTYYAPVQLPQNAKITKLTFYWGDLSVSNECSCTLYKNTMPASYTIAVCSSSGHSGDGSSSDDTIPVSHATVDNSQYSYYLRWYLPNNGCSGYSAILEYTYTEI